MSSTYSTFDLDLDGASKTLAHDASARLRPDDVAQTKAFQRIVVAGLDVRPLELIRALPRGSRLLLATDELESETPRPTIEAWVERGRDVSALEATLRTRFGERVRVIERTLGLRVVLRLPEGESRRRAYDALVGGALRAQLEGSTPSEIVIVLRLQPEQAHAGYVIDRLRLAGIESPSVVELNRETGEERASRGAQAALDFRILATLLYEEPVVEKELLQRGISVDAAARALVGLARQAVAGPVVGEPGLAAEPFEPSLAELDLVRSALLVVLEQVERGPLGGRLQLLVDARFTASAIREWLASHESRRARAVPVKTAGPIAFAGLRS